MTQPPDDAALVARLRKRLEIATPGPWHLCQHLKGEKEDAACPCGYRGVVYGPEDDGYAVFQPGHEKPKREEEWGSEPPRYDRRTEIANCHLIVDAVAGLPGLLDALEAKDRRIAELSGLLKDCADELESEVQERYRGVGDHPAMAPKLARDLATVVSARAALEPSDKGEG